MLSDYDIARQNGIRPISDIAYARLTQTPDSRTDRIACRWHGVWCGMTVNYQVEKIK